MEGVILIQTGKDEEDFRRLRSFEPGEREIIASVFERAWRAKHDRRNQETA